MYNRNFSDGSYGKEVIIDLYDCDREKMTEEHVVNFIQQLVKKVDMETHGEPMVWTNNESDEPHLRGTSAMQFITTSNVVVHTLSLTGLVLVNLFSCKPFNEHIVLDFAKEFFDTYCYDMQTIMRGRLPA
jgi:S-adenosylmethionine decarboxylase